MTGSLNIILRIARRTVGLRDNLKIVLLEFIGYFTELLVELVKLVTIADDFVNIGVELGRSGIIFAL